ncbi:MAG TPA: low molecular weight protein-tyrosine-phosphatase [Marinobacterium sp.]|nr:low molecular weight protein-tyrosine-phosphatase [Marinobacterium sp.]
MISKSVLFVCLGNICRSPTAEAVFRQRARAFDHLDLCVDSAGTGAWHVGESPDPRSQAVGRQRGYPMSDLRARQVSVEDFHQFDYILAMDKSNLIHLQQMVPADYQGELRLFLDYADTHISEVPDPYYSQGDQGFHQVIDLIEAATDGLLQQLEQAGR